MHIYVISTWAPIDMDFIDFDTCPLLFIFVSHNVQENQGCFLL
jgi:hypothetical protein